MGGMAAGMFARIWTGVDDGGERCSVEGSPRSGGGGHAAWAVCFHIRRASTFGGLKRCRGRVSC